MKFATALITLSVFAVSVAAQCRVFRFQVVNSPFTDLNGLYLQNTNGAATIGSPTGIETTAYFDDVAPVQLYVNGVDGEGADSPALVPQGTSGIEQLVFGDFFIAEARYTDWAVIDGVLTYGDVADRFVAFPSGLTDGSYNIYWVPEGTITTANGFAIDLLLECL